jgi:UDP-2-acetamido-3-amino-2,3-dideoxy-glucuronate N-acetyltransferase
MSKYFAHSTACIDEGSKIGKGTKIWHFSHIMKDAVIGENCNLGQNIVVSPGVTLGNGCKVQNNVSIYTGVICEDYVFLGPSMVFTNVINPRAHVIRKDEYKTTKVGQGASIGANATIVCGISIGQYALIGAGAVVIRDVPDFALVVGNPSRQIGWVSKAGHRLSFNPDGLALCSEDNSKYRLSTESNIVTLL